MDRELEGRTLVIGAGGQIGRLCIPLLAEAGARPRAMVRRPTGLQELGAEEVVADLEGDFAHALEGCARIIFTAGSGAHTGYDKTILIDLWGAYRAIDAARAAGIEHFVMVSSRGAEDPDRGPSTLKPYCVCKHVADEYLMRSGLTYSILRPGRLVDGPPTHTITSLMPSDPGAQWITRGDVALAVAYCLRHPHTRGRIYPLAQGDGALQEALR